MLPVVRAIERVLPPHRIDQETAIGALRAYWSARHHNVERLEDLHRASTVKARHFALPLDAYAPLEGFRARNDAWIRCALALAEEAARGALSRAGLEPAAIDHVFFVTTTGLSTPSIEGRLVQRLGLREDVGRTPIFGLGCAGGAAGLGRASDWLRGRPDARALLISVELCSLTLHREDVSIANVVASGLFGDGAAAVVLEGGAHDGEGPRVVAAGSRIHPDTERILGWDFLDDGFKVVLSPKLTEVVRTNLRGDVEHFLSRAGSAIDALDHVVAHTGGPKVLDAVQAALALDEGALERSRRSLREHGNLSSAAVLFVLGDLLDAKVARRGAQGLVVAMGPGFGVEMVLLRW